MAHPSQRKWCEDTRALYENSFVGKRVLDVGSLDINGNNKDLFENCEYIGIDVGEGKNVDVVALGHEYDAEPFDTIISTECFEHDPHYEKTLQNVVRLLKPNGLFVFTCATTGRLPHGCEQRSPWDSPLTMARKDWDHSYYKNITEEDVRKAIPVDETFSEYVFDVNGTDLRFYGKKKQ
jgi:SAM-dependent methyltransferase